MQNISSVYNWVQQEVLQHSVLGVGPFENDGTKAQVIDPVWRFDKNDFTSINPDFILNQRNVPIPQDFTRAFLATFPSATNPSFFDNYRTSGATPVPNTPSVQAISSYLDDYWYLYGSPPDRRTHGFNDFSLGSSAFQFSTKQRVSVGL